MRFPSLHLSNSHSEPWPSMWGSAHPSLVPTKRRHAIAVLDCLPQTTAMVASSTAACYVAQSLPELSRIRQGQVGRFRLDSCRCS